MVPNAWAQGGSKDERTGVGQGLGFDIGGTSERRVGFAKIVVVRRSSKVGLSGRVVAISRSAINVDTPRCARLLGLRWQGTAQQEVIRRSRTRIAERPTVWNIMESSTAEHG